MLMAFPARGKLCVLDGDQLTEVAAGVLSQGTGFPSRTDALFLHWVDRQGLHGDARDDAGRGGQARPRHPHPPLSAGLRGPADARNAAPARHLLSHTSGFDGDRYTDAGGDDASPGADPELRGPAAGNLVGHRQVWSYRRQGFRHPGADRRGARRHSVRTSASWRRRPLGSSSRSRSRTRRWSASRLARVPTARDPSRLVVSPAWGCTARSAPWAAPSWPARVTSCGSSACTCRGACPDGSRLLDSDLVNAMQARRSSSSMTLSSARRGASAGSSTTGVRSTSSVTTGTPTTRSSRRVSTPAERFGFCLQTNVESALTLYRELADWLFGQRLGVTPRRDPDVREDATVTDPARYVGTYARVGLAIDVHVDDANGLHSHVTPGRHKHRQGWPPMVALPPRPVPREGWLPPQAADR